LSASDQKQFDEILVRFGELKHGRALAVLDVPVLNSMIDLWNAADDVESVRTGSEFQEDALSKICNLPFKVVLECRKMLASGFKQEGGITVLNDNYTMGQDLPPSCPSTQPPSNVKGLPKAKAPG
jgi:hypothetical protein